MKEGQSGRRGEINTMAVRVERQGAAGYDRISVGMGLVFEGP